MWTRVGPRKHVLGGVHTGATLRIRLNHPCAAAMRSVVKLLWPLVGIQGQSHCRIEIAVAITSSVINWVQICFLLYFIYLKPNSIKLAGRSWSQTGSKPNSITLSGSKLVQSWSQTGSKLIGDQLRTSFEPDSVMKFGRGSTSSC